jgi:hypothetical protein
MLSHDVAYHDLGADYLTRRDPIRRGNQLLRQLRDLGYDIAVTAEPTAA